MSTNKGPYMTCEEQNPTTRSSTFCIDSFCWCKSLLSQLSLCIPANLEYLQGELNVSLLSMQAGWLLMQSKGKCVWDAGECVNHQCEATIKRKNDTENLNWWHFSKKIICNRMYDKCRSHHPSWILWSEPSWPLAISYLEHLVITSIREGMQALKSQNLN